MEVAYGVEQESQQQGYATEATLACVAWALAGGRARRARDDAHVAQPLAPRAREVRVPLVRGHEGHAMLGELYEFERRR